MIKTKARCCLLFGVKGIERKITNNNFVAKGAVKKFYYRVEEETSQEETCC